MLKTSRKYQYPRDRLGPEIRLVGAELPEPWLATTAMLRPTALAHGLVVFQGCGDVSSRKEAAPPFTVGERML